MGLRETVLLCGALCTTYTTYSAILGVSSEKLSNKNSVIRIKNDTKKTCRVKIEFKFLGPNTLKIKKFDEKGYIIGTAQAIDIVPRSEVTIDALDAVYQKSGPIIDYMKKIYDIAIMKISIDAEYNWFRSREKYSCGLHATSFVIRNDGNRYFINASNYVKDKTNRCD